MPLRRPETVDEAGGRRSTHRVRQVARRRAQAPASAATSDRLLDRLDAFGCRREPRRRLAVLEQAIPGADVALVVEAERTDHFARKLDTADAARGDDAAVAD